MAINIKTYGSICSGIEAASLVMKPLGIQPMWLSEIAEFPKKFLAHKYPHIPNLGDMNDIPRMIETGKIDVPDFICGGTPCQAFSLAGWKKGLNDHRGQLTLKYIDILNAVDLRRESNNQPKAVFLWENVEGVLKDSTNAFGCFLTGLLDLDEPIKYTKWPNAGIVYGKCRNIAWRVLDAKYFGVPQQRRRLFVIGGGKDFNPVDILFEKGDHYLSDPVSTRPSATEPSLFNKFDDKGRALISIINHHEIEVFREYSDCLYAAYGTKWNGNAAAFNGSLFVCQDGRIRRMTPKECERLMGFPDDYTNISPKVRVTNRYQAIGNSWAVPVISWIITRLVNQGQKTIPLPKSFLKKETDKYSLYFFDGFMNIGDGWLNSSTYPYDFSLKHLLDIIDTDADEKFYISPAGCAGIVRRKMERNAGINKRLEFHLRNRFDNNPDSLTKKRPIQSQTFTDSEIGLRVRLY